MAQPSATRKTLIADLREKLVGAYSRGNFIHHEWYVRYHMEIVEKIADELTGIYPDADRDLVSVLVWLHDYGKTIDPHNQHQLTLTEGRATLTAIGFDDAFTDRVVHYLDLVDKKLDLPNAPIEVRIVSSADGCAHFVGPFFTLWWWENPGIPYRELMAGNRRKALKDWTTKIVLPEARNAFEDRMKLVLEQCGTIPDRFL
jgi:hypothetical protein